MKGKIFIREEYAELLIYSKNKTTVSVLISLEDVTMVNSYAWHMHGNYVATSLNGSVLLLHHAIMGSRRVKILNRNPLDCRRENLEERPDKTFRELKEEEFHKILGKTSLL